MPGYSSILSTLCDASKAVLTATCGNGVESAHRSLVEPYFALYGSDSFPDPSDAAWSPDVGSQRWAGPSATYVCRTVSTFVVHRLPGCSLLQAPRPTPEPIQTVGNVGSIRGHTTMSVLAEVSLDDGHAFWPAGRVRVMDSSFLNYT